jgi:hypothetical protein
MECVYCENKLSEEPSYLGESELVVCINCSEILR